MLTLDVLLRESKVDADRIERLGSKHSFDAKQVAEAIASLPEKQRLVLALRFYESLTIVEIATVLGSKIEKVSLLLAQAAETICDLLEESLPRMTSRGESAAGGAAR